MVIVIVVLALHNDKYQYSQPLFQGEVVWDGVQAVVVALVVGNSGKKTKRSKGC